MPIVPDLKDKLEYLYTHYPEVSEYKHPYVKPAEDEHDRQREQADLQKLKDKGITVQQRTEIRNQAELASALGLKSKASISNWITGSTGSPPDYVSDHHFENICDIYSLDEADFSERDFDKFQEIVDLIIEGKRPTWAGFFDSLKVAESEVTMERVRLGETRGVVQDTPQRQLLGARYQLDERFRVCLSGPPNQYVTLILEDPFERAIVCPTSSIVNNKLNSEGLLNLPDENDYPFRTCPPEGQHHWVAIFSEQRLKIPGTAYDTQRTPRHKGITRVVRQLRGLEDGTWSACKMPFYIVAG